jgi:glycosyltransferase involved in cell wall biosynthesis
MTDESVFLSIIIPARNEQENIESTLDGLIPQVNPEQTEIIVVNDHSDDKTVSLVEKLATRCGMIKLVHNNDAPGFANALKTGFRHATGEYVLPMMADSCDDPRTIPLMLEKARQGYDLVCGCRYARHGGKKGGPKIQGFFSRFVGVSLHFLTRIPTLDASNAFKMYRRSIVASMELLEKGFAVSMEAALRFYHSGCSICDVPTIWRGREKGKSKFKISRTFPYVKLYFYALFYHGYFNSRARV